MKEYKEPSALASEIMKRLEQFTERMWSITNRWDSSRRSLGAQTYAMTKAAATRHVDLSQEEAGLWNEFIHFLNSNKRTCLFFMKDDDLSLPIIELWNKKRIEARKAFGVTKKEAQQRAARVKGRHDKCTATAIIATRKLVAQLCIFEAHLNADTVTRDETNKVEHIMRSLNRAIIGLDKKAIKSVVE